MADEYIRKQDVVDYCKALMNAEVVQNTDDWGYGKERYNQTEVILNFIENRQPADVVPVIRCRDCKHWQTDWNPSIPDRHYCAVMDSMMKPDDFCSYGEKREE